MCDIVYPCIMLPRSGAHAGCGRHAPATCRFTLTAQHGTARASLVVSSTLHWLGMHLLTGVSRCFARHDMRSIFG